MPWSFERDDLASFAIRINSNIRHGMAHLRVRVSYIWVLALDPFPFGYYNARRDAKRCTYETISLDLVNSNNRGFKTIFGVCLLSRFLLVWRWTSRIETSYRLPFALFLLLFAIVQVYFHSFFRQFLLLLCYWGKLGIRSCNYWIKFIVFAQADAMCLSLIDTFWTRPMTKRLMREFRITSNLILTGISLPS